MGSGRGGLPNRPKKKTDTARKLREKEKMEKNDEVVHGRTLGDENDISRPNALGKTPKKKCQGNYLKEFEKPPPVRLESWLWWGFAGKETRWNRVLAKN